MASLGRYVSSQELSTSCISVDECHSNCDWRITDSRFSFRAEKSIFMETSVFPVVVGFCVIVAASSVFGPFPGTTPIYL
jgi:hypothetical protein